MLCKYANWVTALNAFDDQNSEDGKDISQIFLFLFKENVCNVKRVKWSDQLNIKLEVKLRKEVVKTKLIFFLQFKIPGQ